MKNLFGWMLAALLALTVGVSCSDDDDLSEGAGIASPAWQAENQAVIEGETLDFEFTAEGQWTAVSSADWCEVKTPSGVAGESLLRLKVAKNNLAEARTACKVDYIVIVRLGKADVLVFGHAFGLHDMISERSSLDTFERNHIGISDMRVDRFGYEFAVKERVEVACGGIELVLGVTSKVFDFDLDLFSTFEHGYDTIFEESLCIGNRFRCRQYGVSIIGCTARSNCK